MRLTVCLPCFGRPERTKRIINQIVEQNIDDWEVFAVGDNCPDFQNLIDTGFFEEKRQELKSRNCKIISSNLTKRYGGWGYEIRNRVKELANGEYFIYLDNDDCIKPNHFQNYLTAIEGTEYDFVYFNTILNYRSIIRNSSVQYGLIGHSEIIVKTSFLKTVPQHHDKYGHDWDFIANMVRLGAKYTKCEKPPTYMVMGCPDVRESGID